MMRSRRVIDNRQINWQKNGQTRLDYRMIFREDDATEKKEEDESKAKLEQILYEKEREWKEKLEKTRKESYQKGFDTGFREGTEQAEEKIDSRINELKDVFERAHGEWRELHSQLEPGLLDLVFEISEKVLGIPIEDERLQQNLGEKLKKLLLSLDDTAKPVLWIAKADLRYVKALKEEYAPELPVFIRIDESYNPGEFRLETNRETVEENFRKKLQDFQNQLNIPSWK